MFNFVNFFKEKAGNLSNVINDLHLITKKQVLYFRFISIISIKKLTISTFGSCKNDHELFLAKINFHTFFCLEKSTKIFSKLHTNPYEALKCLSND